MALHLLWSRGSKQGARERVHRIQDIGIWWYSAWQICWETRWMGMSCSMHYFICLWIIYCSDAVYHRSCTNFLVCKKRLPEIFHNTNSLKRGVLRRVLLAQSMKIPGHTENIEQQQAVESVAAELVSDTSKQVSLFEVHNLWAEKVSDPGNVVRGHMYWQCRMRVRHCHIYKMQ